MISVRSGSSRVPLAPLAALFAFAVLAMAWVASARVCARPIAMNAMSTSMPMPMPMAMPAGTAMICPVVVGLIVLSTVLAAWAIVTVSRDRRRASTLTGVVRALARLPVLRTFGALVAGGGVAIAAIVAVDGGVAFDPSLCAMLALTLAGISIATTLTALVVARCVVALCVRLLVAIAGAIGERRGAVRAFRRRALRAAHASVVAIATGRGLRAPPLLPAH